MAGSDTAPPKATFTAVFAVTEFRALWLAQVLSVAGDQLARVALTLLVYVRTGSALLAAVTFAASVVPAFIGGITLSGLADRFPRRRVMIVCDLTRVVLVAVMAISGIPIAVLVVLLFVVTLIGAPFLSARAALVPDLLTGDLYVLGTAVTLTTLQFAQVLGFAVGGAVVGFFGVPVSLLIDAATFALSALITFVWVRSWPAVQAITDRETQAEPDAGGGLLAGLRLVFTSPALRIPMLLGWLAAFYNIPEGVSAPLAKVLGGGAVAVGFILAAPAFGATVGAVTFSRFVAPARRERWMCPLAVAACGVLILFVFRPPLPIALMVLAVSGLFDCYQLAANASFVAATPARQRSQAFGIAQGGMSLGQGVAMVVAGAAAEHFAPYFVIAASGAVGVVAAIAIAFGRPHAR
ncbi:MAG TPA: MFS transporter [Streptosporangiaceae bacterium]|nr:MFS transporter [Streptosporangiaceae bacterium]